MKKYYENEEAKEKAIQRTAVEFRKYNRTYIKGLCEKYSIDYDSKNYKNTIIELAKVYENNCEQQYNAYWNII